jgi:hypothetical protein
MRDDSFVVLQPFMVTELKLKGNELIIFAIIHGFTVAECSYTGSLQYLMEWTNSTKQGVMKSLKSLIDKGLIVKNEKWVNGVKFCEYTTGKQSLQRWSTEFTRVVNKVYKGGQLSLPNNIDNNKADNKDNNTQRKFVPPTLEEIQKYITEKGLHVDAKQFYDYFEAGNWVDSKGNRVKSWKQKLLTWDNMRKKDPEKKEPTVLGVIHY